MAGIYIHIPFCKQACHYCDFHFSTSLKKKDEMIAAIGKELLLKKEFLSEKVETIYFGGGTPSLLNQSDLNEIFQVIYSNYTITEKPEITLEANPDDLTERKIAQLSETPINRLSIGIQSFFDDNLVWMNRSHDAGQAHQAIRIAKRYFENISIDLIYGVPGLSDERWKENLNRTLELDIPHVSSYALTVEPQTALAKMIAMGKKRAVDDSSARRQYEILIQTLTDAGYINYEFSNFGKEGFFSKNNTAYWTGKSYLGIGPSAHGFDGKSRYWNIRNNTLYIKSINLGELPQEVENLSSADKYNEYIMTRLRTQWGISVKEIQREFGDKYSRHFEKEAKRLFDKKMLSLNGETIHISEEARFLGDGISAALFFAE